MTPNEENWLALCLVEGVGGKTLQRLLAAFGDVEGVLGTDADTLARQAGLSPAVAERVARAREVPAFHTERRLVKAQGARLITMDDAAYPGRLRDVHLPPARLYCQGIWPPPAGPWLSVVGTRSYTRYGEKTTQRLIAELAALAPDAVIVSGLARGIDTVAHEAALANGLTTLAVLGGGLMSLYPPENEALAGRIAQSGALLSEFPMTARPLARNFPMRNRVMGGMTDAVLVVEAGASSGALITASFALNYRRPVLAVPGNLDEPSSEGTNRLIQSGQGRLVREGAELLAALRGGGHPAPQQQDWLAPSAAPAGRPENAAKGIGRAAQSIPVVTAISAEAPETTEVGASNASPPGKKGRILACLRQGALHPDELAGETGLPIEQLIALLLELELSGEIYQTPENHFALA